MSTTPNDTDVLLAMQHHPNVDTNDADTIKHFYTLKQALVVTVCKQKEEKADESDDDLPPLNDDELELEQDDVPTPPPKSPCTRTRIASVVLILGGIVYLLNR